jgi:hypothetical protein
VEALAAAASIWPIWRFSSTLVRIRVTLGFHLYRLRLWYFSGMVSTPQKLAMSTQPGTRTVGMPARAAARPRSGPALSTPPHTSSASSVVVMSSEPAM